MGSPRRTRIYEIPPPPVSAKSATASFYDGDDQRLDGLFFGQETPLKGSRLQGAFYGRDNPVSVESDIAKARYWFEHNPYVREIIRLRQFFYGYKFQISDKNPAVKKWLAKESGNGKAKKTNGQQAREFERSFWNEKLTVDSAVVIWLTSKPKATLFAPELVSYTDIFGQERLSFKPEDCGMKADVIRKLDGLTQGERDKLTQGELVLTRKSNLFDFEVFKSGKPGSGFARPGLKSVLSACAQYENHEVRDNVLAAAGRNVIEHWRIGHEIKSGPHAGNKAHFCTDGKAANLKKSIKDKVGHFRFVSNFDYVVDFPFAAMDQFTGKKYDAVMQRLAWWAMPLGQLITGQSLNPQLLQILRAQALGERAPAADFLKTIFTRCMGAPAEIEFGWGAGIFDDPRTVADKLKQGLNGGPVSQRTYLENMDLNQEEEQTRKETEAKEPKTKTTPIYDAAHGAPDAPGPKRGSQNEPGGGA